jgi:DNA recombination protein RmuC
MPLEQTALIVAGVLVVLLLMWILKARADYTASTMLTGEMQARHDILEEELAHVRNDLTAAVTAKAAVERSLEEIRSRFEDNDRELKSVRADHLSTSAMLSSREATLDALHGERTTLLGKVQELSARCDSLHATNLNLEKQISAAKSELEAQRKLSAQREVEQTAREQQLKQDFEALSNKLLTENSSAFRKQSREELDVILKPLKEALESTKGELAKSKGEAEKHNELLVKQVERIVAEADTLTRVFKGTNPKPFGDLGEELLDGVLRASGLQEGVHYESQRGSLDDEHSRKRPDVIIKLPQGKHLIIDSKASLNNYNQSVNAEDKALKETFLAGHVRDIQKHIKDLKIKHYPKLAGVRSPDFVLMYIPFEQAYIAAMEARPTLSTEALRDGVAIVTNTTLVATLRTVTHVWRLVEQQHNAELIAAQGGKLYDKFCGFVGDLEGLGKALDSCQERYNDAFRKLSSGRGNLMKQAHMLHKLGIKGSKELKQAFSSQDDSDDTGQEDERNTRSQSDSL